MASREGKVDALIGSIKKKRNVVLGTQLSSSSSSSTLSSTGKKRKQKHLDREDVKKDATTPVSKSKTKTKRDDDPEIMDTNNDSSHKKKKSKIKKMKTKKKFAESSENSKKSQKHAHKDVKTSEAKVSSSKQGEKHTYHLSSAIESHEKIQRRFSFGPERTEPSSNITPFPRSSGSHSVELVSKSTEKDTFISLTSSINKQVEKKEKVMGSDEHNFAESIHVPWMAKPTGYSNTNIFLRLHEEIMDFVTFISPREDEKAMRKLLVEKFAALVSSLWPKAQVDTFGSHRTGMYLPSSDIDMVIFGAPTGTSSLFKLADKLQDESFVASIEVVDTARIPIVKFKHKETGIDADVCFGIDGGLQTAELIKGYMRQFPSFRPLVLVLKYFLAQRSLNNTFSGGLGSFLLQLMTLSFLQFYHREYYVEGHLCSNNMYNLGHLLLGFFELFGQDFNYHRVGISVRGDGEFFYKVNTVFYVKDRPHLLCIENPLDAKLDVGKNSYDIRKIRRVFGNSYQVLHAEILYRGSNNQSDRRYRGSLLGHIIHADAFLLRRQGPSTVGFDAIDHIYKSRTKLKKDGHRRHVVPTDHRAYPRNTTFNTKYH